MGIDLPDRGGTRKPGRKELKSPNPYLRLLSQLYNFLARRTDSSFNAVIAKRLIRARRYRTVISLSKIVKNMTGKEDKTCVVVGTVTSTWAMREFEEAWVQSCGSQMQVFDLLTFL